MFSCEKQDVSNGSGDKERGSILAIESGNWLKLLY